MSAIDDMRAAGPPPEVAAVLPRLLRGETVDGVVTLKSGAVHRVGDWVVKLFPRRGPLSRLRPPLALRSVREHFRLLPVLSPEPVHWDRLGDGPWESLLVYRFVDGLTLKQLFLEGVPESRHLLPGLFADLWAKGVLHADLHGQNLIWSSAGWVVLDLAAIRHRLHGLRRRSLTERTWARLLRDLRDDGIGRELYLDFLERIGRPWDPQASWSRIVERSAEIERARETRVTG